MMEIEEAIRGRRSIRAFAEKLVEKEAIEKAVALAAYAPSWKNTQTTRYYAVTDSVLKNTIADTCVLGHSGNQQIIKSAPALLVLGTVTGRSGFERDGSFSTPQGTHWQSFDAGIAAQTFCLAAHSIGLGTVVMGIFDADKTAEAVGLPTGEMVSALVAVGYPAITPNAPPRKGTEILLSWRE